MSIMGEQCLYQVVVEAAKFLFDGGSYTLPEKVDLANWILAHQNRYRGFIFYPSQSDRESGIRLFSGEKPKAKFLVDNVVELETLRILALLQPDAPEVLQVLQDANHRLFQLCFANGCIVGECAHASIAFLRYLIAHATNPSAPKFRRTLDILKQKRSGDGKWRGFPFFFTLLWLTELPDNLAEDELSYTFGYCDQLFATLRLTRDGTDLLRKKIVQRVLTRTPKTQFHRMQKPEGVVLSLTPQN